MLSDAGEGVRPDILMPVVKLESASEGTVFVLSDHTDVARVWKSIGFTAEIVENYFLVCRQNYLVQGLPLLLLKARICSFSKVYMKVKTECKNATCTDI